MSENDWIIFDGSGVINREKNYKILENLLHSCYKKEIHLPNGDTIKIP